MVGNFSNIVGIIECRWLARRTPVQSRHNSETTSTRSIVALLWSALNQSFPAELGSGIPIVIRIACM
ncbi:hypothetical protein J6590_087701, partial [Homalodisca vitripennis]